MSLHGSSRRIELCATWAIFFWRFGCWCCSSWTCERVIRWQVWPPLLRSRQRVPGKKQYGANREAFPDKLSGTSVSNRNCHNFLFTKNCQDKDAIVLGQTWFLVTPNMRLKKTSRLFKNGDPSRFVGKICCDISCDETKPETEAKTTFEHSEFESKFFYTAEK